ncbi:hypothetical protein [Gephyromycinifex aptenodytis]|uniref:hypothetical protein n=1 Tax=Gephyromycinifex aptenodytis TaxID=2716227 RepID=UPI001D013699|nr:hypothetical protein [Gephyromycinifex aptenodytis]
MSIGDSQLMLCDAQDVADLTTFLSRARLLDPRAVRLQAVGEVLAMTVCALEGTGLLGGGTVLGMRAFGLLQPAWVDTVVALEAMADRLARMQRENSAVLSVPPVSIVVPWAGQAPPRSGWEPANGIAAEELRECARAGIEALAGQPAGLRDPERVWRAPVPGHPGLPAGAAFAAHTLGFLPAAVERAEVFTHGRWQRVATPAGQVLVH